MRGLSWRKMLLLGATAATAALLSYWRADPIPEGGYEHAAAGKGLGPEAKENIARHLRDSWRAPVDADDLRLTDGTSGPLGYGRLVTAYYAAPPAPGQSTDIFAARYRLSATGVPVAARAPTNLTATSEGHEILLDAVGDRVLYATRVGERYRGAVLLDFAQSWAPKDLTFAGRLVARLAARQLFGTWDGPTRLDVLFATPPAVVHGKLSDTGINFVVDDGHQIRLDLESQTFDPPDSGRLLAGAPPQRETLSLLADLLRRTDVVGSARVAKLEGIAFKIADLARRLAHRVFPTAADRLPVSVDLRVPTASEQTWPPPTLPIEGLPGEGRWVRPDALEGEADPPVRVTFIRVDPDRPFQRTHLFAFDTGRLGVRFVGGSSHPRSTTGARGTGRVPDAHRPALVGAFNGGFKAEHGLFGAIEDQRVLIPPVVGLATVVMDHDGELGMGRWDALELRPPWRDLRQNLSPLLADGVVNPARSRRWGDVVAELDQAQTPRSAMGLTARGVLVYAWSSATSAEGLGEAMRRAGVEFAVHLDMNPGHTGLELYPRGAQADVDEPESVRGVPEMDFRQGRWLQTDTRDFFYLYDRTRVSLAHEPSSAALSWSAEDVWGGKGEVGAAARIESAWHGTAANGAGGSVRLLRVDQRWLRPHVAPGHAESRPATGVASRELTLRGAPALWLPIGLRAPGSPYGFVADRLPWRAPRRGQMAIAVDEDGETYVGRWGRKPLTDDHGWSDVIQGPALLEGGHPAAGLTGPEGVPAVGAGLSEDGRLLLAVAEDGDRRALAASLHAAGATEAVLLGEVGTGDTGAARFVGLRDGRLVARTDRQAPLQPVELSAGAGSALVFAPRPAAMRGRILPGF